MNYIAPVLHALSFIQCLIVALLVVALVIFISALFNHKRN